ncbi:MAG TPA: Rieske 2Fe-2S domain-containing protein [Myxococcaceae bacterium]|nr:Rieske 2Fe-2S domain-containing protein [Myxococcaceae bacterium]
MSARRLGPVDRVPPGEGRSFDVGGLSVAVFRMRGGALFATQARCPHRSGPLADGIVGGGTVICPLHGFQYDLATGQPRGHGCPALRTYRIELDRGGEMLIDLDEP